MDEVVWLVSNHHGCLWRCNVAVAVVIAILVVAVIVVKLCGGGGVLVIGANG